MNNFDTENFGTESHSEELDFIFNQDSDNLDAQITENLDIPYIAKTYFRLLRKRFSSAIREKLQKNFTNIIYLTLECPPFSANSLREDSPIEFIEQMRKQYPDNNIKIIIPIIGQNREEWRTIKKPTVELNGQTYLLDKALTEFDFFLQNRIVETSLYEFPKNKSNIKIYGLFSPAYSFCTNISELSKIQYLAPFIKSARICIKKLTKNKELAPDIVHCENIPFFLGAEFENKLPYPAKILQTVKDFTQIEMLKTEAFWAVINLADKNAMKKICRDGIVKKCVAALFKLHNTKRFYQMKDCLNFVYRNYSKFRKYVDKGEDIEENIIFNRLNARALQLFPQTTEENQYYNIMSYSLKRADFWVTSSKTYYKDVFENPTLSGKMFPLLEKTRKKSNYVLYGIDTEKYPTSDTREIYQTFNCENFRDFRHKNKTALLKEFSADRIKTGFVDTTLFNNADVKIVGSLDSFYEAPLIFANINTEIFANGADILFNTILKLFELHKNIQVILSAKDGMKVNFIKSWVDFLSQNKGLNGRWVFIDGEIKLPKFLAAADMTFIPRRTNFTGVEHYLAMHYGCVPIVSRCGILNDTVADIFDDISNGCGFKTKTALITAENSNELFLTPVLKALNVYQNNPSSWHLLVKNCLNKDCSWNFKILERYYRIYKEMM